MEDNVFKTGLIKSEERAWSLFKKKAGKCVDNVDLYSIAKDIVHECKGSPGAIIAVGKALQNEKNNSLWESALKQLRSPNPTDLPAGLADVYKPLKLCYDGLDQPAQFLFLLCSMFAKGDELEIQIELLTRYGIGLRIFEGIGNLEEARNKTRLLVKMLKSRLFLISIPRDFHDKKKNYVKMPSVVHKMAMYIIGSKEGHSLFRISHGSSSDWQTSYYFGDCSAWKSVEIPSRRSIELPVGLESAKINLPFELKYANVHLLIVEWRSMKERSSDQLRDHCFQEMQELNVLSFRNFKNRSLPSTTRLLKNLRKLHLFKCENLETLSVVGKVTSLEILSCEECHSLLELTAEVGRLNCLKLLELYQCKNLKTIAPGVISSLIRLEELKMRDSFTGWEAEEKGKEGTNASLTELQSLPNLTCLEIELFSYSAPKEIVLSSKIVKYNISVFEGKQEPDARFIGSNWTPEKYVCLAWPRENNLGNWIHMFLKRAEAIKLIGEGSEKLNFLDIRNLRSLELGANSTMKTLLNTIDWKSDVFPQLMALILRDLSELQVICCGPILAESNSFRKLRELSLTNLPKLTHFWKSAKVNISLSNLISIRISKCESLPNLFPVSMARNLVFLEVLEIYDCAAMREVFFDDIGNEGKLHVVFPKLKELILIDLPSLEALCIGVESIKFPLLKAMKIKSCGKLTSLVPIDNDVNLEGHDHNTIHVLCNNKVTICSLKKLSLRSFPNLRSIWCCQIPASSLERLKDLKICDFPSIDHLFSSAIAKTFVNLKWLRISACDGMVQVIADDERVFEKNMFPKLEWLSLSQLPALRSFWQTSHDVKFPSLDHVTIIKCPCMETFTLGSLDIPDQFDIYIDYNYVWMKDLNGAVQQHFKANTYSAFGNKEEEKEKKVKKPAEGEKDKSLSSYKDEKLFGRRHDVSRYLDEESSSMVIQPGPKRYLQDESNKETWQGDISSEAEKEEIQETSDEDNLEMSTGEEDISSKAEKGEIQETSDEDNLEMSTGEEDNSSKAEKGEIQETSDEDNLEMSAGEEDISSEAEKGEIDEICQKDDLEMSIETQNKCAMESCILHCSVLPNHYEFTKEMLVWLWVAQGLIKAGGDGELENEGFKFFDNLLNLKFFVPSRYDHNSDQMKYVMGDEILATSLEQQNLGSRFGKVLGNEQSDSTKLEHLSLSSEEIDRIDFGILKRCNNLQTLIIHRCYGSKVVRLPSDILPEMKSLKVLSLSHTNLVELPSSVQNLGELRYLDMSDPPIKRLPASLCCLVNLQTLQLESCLNLMRLPKCMNKLTNLRHLVLDIARQLQSMPTGIGELTELRTLRTFLVGQDDGCTIAELKKMNKLTGSLRILKLENVLNKEEASMARLHEKQYLKTIELRWSDLQDEKIEDEEEILECLLPPSSIQELMILFYSGGVFPSWISNPSFNEMVSLTLYKCRYCSSMPSLGELTSLKYLSIVGMNEVTEINRLFCRNKSDYHEKLSFVNRLFYRNKSDYHRVAFPKLEKLSFDSMSSLERWTGIEDGDFPCLSHLVIEYCPKFNSLEFLSHLKSLLHFEIRYCPELSSLPKNGLPPLLESLMINECQKLTERCCNHKAKEWPKVAHVPTFYIDNQKVSADT